MLDFVATIVAAFCIFGVVCCVWSALSKRMYFFECAQTLDSLVNSLIGTLRLPLLAIGLLGVLITNAAVHQLVGIHNLELKPEGTYCFYVEAHREGGNTYTLPAEIEVSDTESQTHTNYYIKKVLFSNGSWLDADDGEPDDIGKPSAFFDDDSDWELTLLNEHAYSPLVKETDNADWLDITFLLINLSAVAMFLRIACRKRAPSTSAD